MEDTKRLIEILKKNDLLMRTFEIAKGLEFASYYIGAGCITQTVWNALTNRPVNYGIVDIDLVYYDDTDLSYEAENKVILKTNKLFSEIPIGLDIKNQARVHIWYKEKYGIEMNKFKSLEQAIDTWPSTANAIGMRIDSNNDWKIYAPFGLNDLFNLTIRPNKSFVTEYIYTKKANKWKAKWPELKLIAWDQC